MFLEFLFVWNHVCEVFDGSTWNGFHKWFDIRGRDTEAGKFIDEAFMHDAMDVMCENNMGLIVSYEGLEVWDENVMFS